MPYVIASQASWSEVKEFECKQCGECCGPVPISRPELTRIKQAVHFMPKAERERIKAQERDDLTCILLDQENKRCSIYCSRPLICKLYGRIREMRCPNNQGLKLDKGSMKSMEEVIRESAGILSLDIGWESLEG